MTVSNWPKTFYSLSNMSLKRARTNITASEKLELLEQFKKLPKMSERKATEALEVKRGFLRLAIQNEAKIRAEATEQRGNNRKRHRTGKNEDVENGLYDWYRFDKLRVLINFHTCVFFNFGKNKVGANVQSTELMLQFYLIV